MAPCMNCPTSHNKRSSRNSSSHLGFSLVEILVAIGIFAIIAGSVTLLAADSFRASYNARMRIKAVARAQEVSNAVTMIKDDSWGAVLDLSDGVPKHLVFTDGYYSFADGEEEDGDLTISTLFSDVYRDANKNIVESDGTLDPHTKAVTTTASWTSIAGWEEAFSTTTYINDWNTLEWEDTTADDFNQGTSDLVEITAEGDGSIQLSPKLYANWCLPELMITSYDLPGSAAGNVVIADPGNIYVGTGTEFADPGSMAFMHMTIDTADPPNVDVTGTFDGYTVKDIFGEPGYAYIATTNDSKEVVILDISQVPFQEIGYYDAPGSSDALAVYVSGNRGYVTQGRELRVFDLTQKTGARPQLGTIRASPFQLPFMTALVTDVVVVGNYAFCSLYNDWYEMTIINVSNPASMSITDRADFNWAQATALFASSDGNRVYIGTGSSGGAEFFIINTTNKSNATIINSYDTNGMSVKGLSVIEGRAILVGRNGEEYQVVDISNELSLSKCGGMQMNAGISDIATVNFEGILFSYILTGDTGSEFKVIRGGLDTGGGWDGRGYVETGTFISRVYDTGSDSASFYYVDWDEILQENTDIQIQYRTGPLSNLSGRSWMGPDGTDTTFFTDPAGAILPSQLSGNRYVQYKIVMSSDTDHTPVFEGIRTEYQ
ncbi:MAG: prepilin-type N-terminal cleavage/methylation domain-containing protein [Candidatus Dojkabacteria bacterium]|nr:prepilin-type N-terminal cleavage/methylation domain-containing protein [Candidatus Dojkabacteria bacterium]